jgi:hypothetical protein
MEVVDAVEDADAAEEEEEVADKVAAVEVAAEVEQA